MRVASSPPLKLNVTDRIGVRQLRTTVGVQLSGWIAGVCAAPEPNCVLVADWSARLVVRMSLATQCLDECITRVSESDGRVTAVQLLPGAAVRIALILSLNVGTAGTGLCRHSVRLLARQSHTWNDAHDAIFDNTEENMWGCNGLCVSHGLLLCAVLQLSRRLVAMEVTSDSKLRAAGTLQFDSVIKGICAFASSGEQLVATTHADNTVRLWRHLATATNSGAIALQQCCSVVSEIWVIQIVCADTGLLVSNGGDIVQLCKVDGLSIGKPIAQPQLENANILCWCRVQNTVVAFDLKSASLLTIGTKTQ